MLAFDDDPRAGREGLFRLVPRAVEEVLDVHPQLDHRGVAQSVVDRHRPADDRRQGSRQSVTADHHLRGEKVTLLGADHLQQESALIRRLAGQDMVESAAEQEDVAALVDQVPAAPGLFGRHVGRRADDVGGRRVLRFCLGVAVRRFDDSPASHAPVHDVDLAELADHDVRGLEVAVHHAAAVGESDGLADLEEDTQELGEPGRFQPVPSFQLEQTLEGLTFDQFHADEHGSIPILTDLIDRDDVGMVELTGDPGLFDEAIEVVFVPPQILVQELECGLALQ